MRTIKIPDFHFIVRRLLRLQHPGQTRSRGPIRFYTEAGLYSRFSASSAGQAYGRGDHLIALGHCRAVHRLRALQRGMRLQADPTVRLDYWTEDRFGSVQKRVSAYRGDYYIGGWDLTQPEARGLKF